MFKQSEKESEKESRMKSIKIIFKPRQAWVLGASMMCIFISLIYIISSGSTDDRSPVLLIMSAITTLIVGIYSVTNIISSIPDALLFTLYKRLSFKVFGDTRSSQFPNVMVGVVFCLSSLFLGGYAENTGALIIGAFIFSMSFPFLIINLRYGKRKRIYQVLLKENAGTN